MRKVYLGVDLGTSGLKLLLLSAEGEIINSHTETYPIFYPQAGWAEQNPEDWYAALLSGLAKLLSDDPALVIQGIGIAGQMHGLVVLDEKDRVIRPAILWNDGRSEEEVHYLNEEIGKEQLISWTGNIAFAGFTAPKILWMRKHEPENYKRIAKVMLPKDYLQYRLTGVLATDVSDASGMLLLNVERRCWSQEMLEICGLKENQLPEVYESFEKVGIVSREIIEKFALSKECFVVAGAGDNAAAALGAGALGNGRCNLSLGTSGTVLVGSTEYKKSKVAAIHNFGHADGTYHYLGCILSAASAFDWWIQDILETDFTDQEEMMFNYIGQNEIIFLPYLMGERSPHNDPDARAAFIGMNRESKRAHMNLAVLEGVAFALRDSLDSIRELGIPIETATLVGGGAKNKIWREVIANVLNVKVQSLSEEGGPSLGAAILAVFADGACSSLEEACLKTRKISEEIEPNKQLVAAYNSLYQRYKSLYPILRDYFKEAAAGN